MKIGAAPLLALILVMLVSCSMPLEYITPGKDICRLFQNDVKLRKPGTCSEGITCKDFVSVSAGAADVCTSTKGYWDRNSKKCIQPPKTLDKYCQTACALKAPKYVRDKKNCIGWNECNGAKQLSEGICLNNLHFDQKAQLCVYPDQSDCVPSFSFCDVVPDNIAFQDEYNCHLYYQCIKGELKSFACETGRYYDVKSGICLPKAQVKCEKHPLPPDVCGNHKLVKRGKFVSDGATCSGYFYCKEMASAKPDPDPAWSQCTDGMFFDERLGYCMDRTHVKCFEDRCDGRGNGTALSSKSGCQHYLICENSITVSEEFCGNGQYYNVFEEACTYQKTYYTACSY